VRNAVSLAARFAEAGFVSRVLREIEAVPVSWGDVK
jgi:hypothetical protein